MHQQREQNHTALDIACPIALADAMRSETTSLNRAYPQAWPPYHLPDNTDVAHTTDLRVAKGRIIQYRTGVAEFLPPVSKHL